MGLTSSCHFGANHHFGWANCSGRSGIPKESPKRADYILRHRRYFPIAVMEAKADSLSASAGLGQAKE
jgi:type I site-specific restriction endonuclease